MRKLKLLSLLVLLMTAVTSAWAQNHEWLKPGDTWDESTKTLTVNSNPEESAYEYNSYIEKVVIAASVTEIGESAFYYSPQIATVEFAEGSSLTTIGDYAFNYCDLTSIDIPASVTSVGVGAFACNYNLVSVTFNGPSLTYYGEGAFDETSSNLHISVPEGAEEAYRTGWPDYAGIIGDSEESATTYNVTFSANGNSKTIENITLPKTFKCDYNNGMQDPDELDNIIRELYDGDYSFCNNNVEKSGSDQVEAGTDGNYNDYITIKGAFEGTVTVTGGYLALDYEEKSYSITITVTSNASEPTGAYAVSLKAGTADATNWTIDPTSAAEGATVTLTYTGTKKVKSVKVVKKEDLLSVTVAANGFINGDKTIYFIEGETWEDAITNHPTKNAGWFFIYDDCPTYTGYTNEASVFVVGGSWVEKDELIDPSKNYHFRNDN